MRFLVYKMCIFVSSRNEWLQTHVQRECRGEKYGIVNSMLQNDSVLCEVQKK